MRVGASIGIPEAAVRHRVSVTLWPHISVKHSMFLESLPAVHIPLQLFIQWKRNPRPNSRFPAQSRAPIRGIEALEAASIVLIAGLAVDEAGTRLGQGGGWYDRALLYKDASAPVVACIFDWEYRGKELLPREDHDIPVDGVITPSHFIKLGIK